MIKINGYIRFMKIFIRVGIPFQAQRYRYGENSVIRFNGYSFCRYANYKVLLLVITIDCMSFTMHPGVFQT